MMNFKYKLDLEKKEVTLLGIEGTCPKELHVPSFIEINGEKIMVTSVNFGSPLPSYFPDYGQGVVCEIVHIPETVRYVVFANNNHIKEVFFPNSLKKIGMACFRDCKNLKTVHLPNQLECIAVQAFRNCVNLENVSLPPTLTAIEPGAFKNCESLVEITIPSGVKELSSYLFQGCVNLKEIKCNFSDIPYRLNTFYGCKNLSKLEGHIIENGLLYNSDKTELRSYLGNDSCGGHVIVPESVRDIGYVFSESEDLISIDLSKTQITELSFESFYKCINLQQIKLPSSLKVIETSAFNGCIKLSKIDIPNSVDYIGPSCFKDSGIKEITIPKNVEEILESVFKGCKKLEFINIHYVKKIKVDAFEDCENIRHVSISEGFREHLPKLFKNHDKIVFSYFLGYRTPQKRSGAYTHGRMRPCPYCGSDNVNTFCDGTAECNNCGGEYTYYKI